MQKCNDYHTLSDHVSTQSCPKQPSTSGQAFDENSLSAVDNASGASSIEHSLDYSYDLATSTADESEVGIVSRVVKRRDTIKRKKQKKPRRAEISDVDSQMEEDTTHTGTWLLRPV